MNDTNHNGSSFLPTFIFGVLIGGGIVFLLGTKKGKQLLKTITEEGLEGIAEVEDLVEEVAERYDEPPVVVVEQQIKKEEVQEQKPTGVKRFFKGIRKK